MNFSPTVEVVKATETSSLLGCIRLGCESLTMAYLLWRFLVAAEGCIQKYLMAQADQADHTATAEDDQLFVAPSPSKVQSRGPSPTKHEFPSRTAPTDQEREPLNIYGRAMPSATAWPWEDTVTQVWFGGKLGRILCLQGKQPECMLKETPVMTISALQSAYICHANHLTQRQKKEKKGQAYSLFLTAKDKIWPRPTARCTVKPLDRYKCQPAAADLNHADCYQRK